MRSYLWDLADGGRFLGVEVICHGVPSPGLWRRWLAHLEAPGGGEVRAVNFRSKATGWESYSVAYELASAGGGVSVRSVPHGDDWYMCAFLANASLRASCLSCPFKRRCGSDLTLGDYWGIRRQHSEVLAEGGVSAVIANTGKGAMAIDRVRGSMVFGESSFEKVLAGNPSLARSAAPHVDRERFMDAVASGMPIPDMMARWSFAPTAIQRVKSSIKRTIKAVLRRS